MTARALLVASQMFGLTGCERDAALMRQVLEERGFSCTTLLTAEGTRAGIMTAFDELIAATGAEDAAVFYYSGHGGRMPLSDWRDRRAAGQPSHLQFLVPSDIELSTEEDFRGLLGEELTAIQRRLTDRTQNVTTILDCCHSAYMARGLSPAIPRSPPMSGTPTSSSAAMAYSQRRWPSCWETSGRGRSAGP
ncbi:MAG: caspase family protein [Actinobacteria bacterium]|nr:caspase family protein [Actinomycetota bacterium]